MGQASGRELRQITEGENGNMRAVVTTIDRNESHVLKKVILAAHFAQGSCMEH